MDKMQALHSFWSSFGWKAYNENSIPDNAVLPYITYEAGTDSFGYPIALAASLFCRDTGWATLVNKAEQIKIRIDSEPYINYDGGAIRIMRASPWVNDGSDSTDDTILIKRLNIMAEFLD